MSNEASSEMSKEELSQREMMEKAREAAEMKEKEALGMLEDIKGTLERIFGREVNLVNANFKPVSGSMREWKAGGNQKVRQILELYIELSAEGRASREGFPQMGSDGMAIMIGIGMAVLVINGKGQHMECLKELYIDFVRHVQGDREVAESMLAAMREMAEESQTSGPNKEEWEEAIRKMADQEGG